jgi:hypothetical protein
MDQEERINNLILNVFAPYMIICKSIINDLTLTEEEINKLKNKEFDKKFIIKVLNKYIELNGN